MTTPTQNQLGNRLSNSFAVPPFDYQAFTYIGSGASDDDDVATITYKRGGASGTTVAVLTFTYSGSTNNIATATLTL